jgi:hypothetical protein
MVPVDGGGESLPVARYLRRVFWSHGPVPTPASRFFPLVLLRTEGSYAASEFPSSALLSLVIGEHFWGGGEGDHSLGVNRLDPPA